MSQAESSSMTKTRDNLFQIVMRGGWDEVIQIYKDDPEAQKDRITRSGYTALHLAVSDGKEDIVKDLIKVLLEGDQTATEELPIQNDAGDPINTLLEGDHTAKEVLAMQNDAGNTPLHIAASMGNVRMCKFIADVDSSLIGIKNNDGETPLFLAALHGKKDAFLCLNSFCRPELGISYCRRNDGNSILHCTIVGEYFDLAFQIIYLYRDLVNFINSAGLTPLDVLASKSSAFESGSHLGRFQKTVYEILSVDKLKVDKTYEEKEPKNEPNTSCPQNYQTLVNFFRFVGQIFKGNATACTEEELASEEKGALKTRDKDLAPPNYVTCFEFVKVVYKAILVLTGPGYGVITNILYEKRKHTWSLQVLDELLLSPAMYLYHNAGELPSIDNDRKELILTVSDSEDGYQTILDPQTTAGSEKSPVRTKEGTAILIAAKHGITEIVKKILKKYPIAIHDTGENKKNIVLIAVESRQLEVYKLLLRKYTKNEGIFRHTDKYGNGALHFAARLRKEHPRWPIPGDALQMQWEIKWLKFVEESMPPRFFARYNKNNQTPDEIFTQTHKNLVESGGKWLTNTCLSCSVVGGLFVTIAFTTSTTMPGGAKQDTGTPYLEHEPAFDVFAISSMVTFYSSVIAVVMFLAIITSGYQMKDFQKSLPGKLLVGLTALYVAIASTLISFSTGHFFMLRGQLKEAAPPVYSIICLLVTIFAIGEFPLYFQLALATFKKVPQL